jgi:hypothetical protein
MRRSSHLKVTEVTGSYAGLQVFCLRVAATLSGLVHNRGMQRMTWALAPLFDSQNTAVVELPSGGKLQIYLNDGYWSRLFIKGFNYEPEIGHVLGCVLTQPDTYFLDIGANIGYWSVMASRLLLPGRVMRWSRLFGQFSAIFKWTVCFRFRLPEVLAGG